MNKTIKTIVSGVAALALASSLAACVNTPPTEWDEPSTNAGDPGGYIVIADLITAAEMGEILGGSVQGVDEAITDANATALFDCMDYQVGVTLYQEAILSQDDPRKGTGWVTYLAEVKADLSTEEDFLGRNFEIERSILSDLGDLTYLTFVDSSGEIQLDVFVDAYWLNVTLTYSTSLADQIEASTDLLTTIGERLVGRLAG